MTPIPTPTPTLIINPEPFAEAIKWVLQKGIELAKEFAIPLLQELLISHWEKVLLIIVAYLLLWVIDLIAPKKRRRSRT